MQQLLKNLQLLSASLPQAQRKAAEYILSHYQDVPFLSVTELAARIGVSDTTVIKLCARLGYTGYLGFRRELAALVRSDMTMYANLENRIEGVDGESVLDQVMACDLQNVERTLTDPQNRRAFPRLLERLDRARRVYVCGFRTAASQAEFLAVNLQLQDRDVRLMVPGMGHFTDELCRITKDDLFLAFVFSRYSADVVQALSYLRERGVFCCAVTDGPSSPAYGLAELSFFCATASRSYQASYAGCSALSNAVITAASMRRMPQTTEYLKRLEDVFARFDTFYL